jgi:hypothetical protein
MYIRGVRGGPFVLDSASPHISVQSAYRLMQILVVNRMIPFECRHDLVFRSAMIMMWK